MGPARAFLQGSSPLSLGAYAARAHPRDNGDWHCRTVAYATYAPVP